jgi:drug/metabolite transporter (DMT)-like permease
MHLGEAMLLKMTAPLFIPFVALFWLREKLSGRVLLALAIGFGGVTLVISPDLRQFDPVALIALLGGALAALAKVTVRRLSRSEPAPRTVFYFALTGALVSALPLCWAWQTPGGDALLWMLAVSLFATLGQLLMTRGFAFAPAGQLSAFTYSSVVFASLYGWVLWHEVIRWSTISGALLVALAGVLAARARGDRTSAIA